MARDRATAEKFLQTIEWYRNVCYLDPWYCLILFGYFYIKYAANHGHSAEGNPSGGNKYRGLFASLFITHTQLTILLGLYNIALKSLGAAMKKRPDVTLDHVSLSSLIPLFANLA